MPVLIAMPACFILKLMYENKTGNHWSVIIGNKTIHLKNNILNAFLSILFELNRNIMTLSTVKS